MYKAQLFCLPNWQIIIALFITKITSERRWAQGIACDGSERKRTAKMTAKMVPEAHETVQRQCRGSAEVLTTHNKGR
jgi:hypothetical protein